MYIIYNSFRFNVEADSVFFCSEHLVDASLLLKLHGFLVEKLASIVVGLLGANTREQVGLGPIFLPAAAAAAAVALAIPRGRDDSPIL
jgi:hypothetical protein